MWQRCQTDAARTIAAVILTLLILLSFYMSMPFSYGKYVPSALSSTFKPLGFGAFMSMYAKLERKEGLILSSRFFFEIENEKNRREWPSNPAESRFRDRFFYFGSRFSKMPAAYWQTFCVRRASGIMGAGQTLRIHWRQFATENPGAPPNPFAQGLFAQCSNAP